MLLYHGTTAAAVPSILEHGLLPRQASGLEPTSPIFEFQGHPECVYLANAYSSYFAAEIVGSEHGFTGSAAILEIDADRLDDGLFLPDDFVMAQMLAENPRLAHESFEEIAALARDAMTHNHGEWKNSLYLMGTCAYQGIVPPAAIARVCYVDFSKMQPAMLFDIIDISVSVEAFKICGIKYRMLDSWFWGAEVEFGFGLLSNQQLNQRTMAKARKEFRELWSDRSMVRIEECQ